MIVKKYKFDTKNLNIYVILKLLIGIKDFSINYNLKKIYSNFKAFKLKDFINNNVDLLLKQ